MAAEAWEEGASAPAKRGLPGWLLWGCGGGCLVATLALVALAALAGRVVHQAKDPETTWAAVAELLPHDERPPGWEAVGATVFGVGVYVLRSDDAVVVVHRVRKPEDAAALLDPEPAGGVAEWLFPSMGAAERGTIVLQGREAPCLRFDEGFESFRRDARGSAGTGIRVDVTGAGVPTVLHLGTEEDGERISDARVNELLAPFDVWRGR